jgi:hypothetical protein
MTACLSQTQTFAINDFVIDLVAVFNGTKQSLRKSRNSAVDSPPTKSILIAGKIKVG